MSTFGLYARYYDLLYKDKDYGVEAAYIDSLIRAHAPQAQSIIELGCGTGAHAEHFARMGYRIDGIDLSEQMLASAEARKSGLPADLAGKLSFAKGDVRTWDSGKTYDVVLSLFHVFSYQVSNADLLSAFETAARHLVPGGILIFDFWHGPGVMSDKPAVRVKRLSDEQIQVTRIAEPELFPAENRVRVNYLVLIDANSGGTSERVNEQHDMRYLFVPEIQQMSSPWFEPLSFMGWMSDDLPGCSDWVAACVLKRKP